MSLKKMETALLNPNRLEYSGQTQTVALDRRKRRTVPEFEQPLAGFNICTIILDSLEIWQGSHLGP